MDEERRREEADGREVGLLYVRTVGEEGREHCRMVGIGRWLAASLVRGTNASGPTGNDDSTASQGSRQGVHLFTLSFAVPSREGRC